MSGTSHSATLKQVSRATLYNQHNWWIPQKRWLWAYIILQLVWGKRIIKLCISGHYVRALSAPPWILLFNISNILFYGNLSSRLGRWNHQFGFSSWNCNPAFTKVAAWSVLSHGRRGKSPNVTMMQFTHQSLELLSLAHLSGFAQTVGQTDLKRRLVSYSDIAIKHNQSLVILFSFSKSCTGAHGNTIKLPSALRIFFIQIFVQIHLFIYVIILWQLGFYLGSSTNN